MATAMTTATSTTVGMIAKTIAAIKAVATADSPGQPPFSRRPVPCLIS